MDFARWFILQEMEYTDIGHDSWMGNDQGIEINDVLWAYKDQLLIKKVPKFGYGHYEWFEEIHFTRREVTASGRVDMLKKEGSFAFHDDYTRKQKFGIENKDLQGEIVNQLKKRFPGVQFYLFDNLIGAGTPI